MSKGFKKKNSATSTESVEVRHAPPPVRKESMDASAKRNVQVVEAEQELGNIEYKRQVSANASPNRYVSLSTQMAFRLDEGSGQCIYRVGVEDDGCHSLLTYEEVAESCRTLELIARSLNAVVVERRIIQHEVVRLLGEENVPVLADTEDPVVVLEPSILGDAMGRRFDVVNGDEDPSRIQLSKDPASFTRAELTIQRVETHLLDPAPYDVMTNESNTGTNIKETSLDEVNDGNGYTHRTSSADELPKAKAADVTDSNHALLAAKEALSHSVGETLSSRNIRVAVVGNVDAGKSTLIGSLTTSMLDDGRGRCRTSIMKHRHEIETGRTSTATTHLMGFRSTGEPIAGKDQIRTNKRKGEDEIARESYRVITLMDLAGHEKYLKTTIHGVSSGFADYSLILVNSRHPPTHMTQHHLNLCCSFGIPVIVIFTKIDGCPEHAFKNCKEEVIQMLRSPEIRRKPFAVRTEEDVATVMDKLHTLAPMIETSCVTGEGMELLQKMLFCLPKRRRHENKANRSFEFLVEDIFFNVPGVGAVTSGFVNAGELTVGPNCHVFIGPIDDGTFIKTVAKSAHISRISTSHITAGQSACLAFAMNKELRKKLRRGMVVLKENPTSTLQFDAEICVLKGEGTTIRRSYQAYVHILNVRQSAYARQIEIVNHHTAGLPPGHSSSLAASSKMDEEEDEIVLRPGSRAKVRFEFAKRPEYIRPGMRMLFRDGRVRGIGIITAVPAS